MNKQIELLPVVCGKESTNILGNLRHSLSQANFLFYNSCFYHIDVCKKYLFFSKYSNQTTLVLHSDFFF